MPCPYGAGDGPERRALGRLAVARGLADRVEFVGHVSDIDVRLRDVDVLMHTACSETFGMALMEAAASHVPVVCLGGGALREMVPRYARRHYCGRTDTGGAFAAAVLEAAAIDDPELFSLADQRRRDSFRAELVLDRWQGVLDRLAKREVIA